MVQQVIIKEEKVYSIGSDHNFLTVSIAMPDKLHKSNISDKSNWNDFKLAIEDNFSTEANTMFTRIDDMWSYFKELLLSAGSKTRINAVS